MVDEERADSDGIDNPFEVTLKNLTKLYLTRDRDLIGLSLAKVMYATVKVEFQKQPSRRI